MAKALLYLDENLASSIALKYVDYLNSLIELTTSIIHVVQSDNKKQIAQMLKEGEATISRLLKTEKVKYGFNGPPKIKMGDKSREVLKELREGAYDIFIEGHSPVSKRENLNEVTSSELYRKSPCSILYVKNLSISRTIGVLVGMETDLDAIAYTLNKLLKESEMDIELICYNYKDVDNLEFVDVSDIGAIAKSSQKILEQQGLNVSNIHGVVGTPEAMSDFLLNYAFVASCFSPREPLIFETLAQTQNSVLLCKQ